MFVFSLFYLGDLQHMLSASQGAAKLPSVTKFSEQTNMKNIKSIHFSVGKYSPLYCAVGILIPA